MGTLKYGNKVSTCMLKHIFSRVGVAQGQCILCLPNVSKKKKETVTSKKKKEHSYIKLIGEEGMGVNEHSNESNRPRDKLYLTSLLLFAET